MGKKGHGARSGTAAYGVDQPFSSQMAFAAARTWVVTFMDGSMWLKWVAGPVRCRRGARPGGAGEGFRLLRPSICMRGHQVPRRV